MAEAEAKTKEAIEAHFGALHKYQSPWIPQKYNVKWTHGGKDLTSMEIRRFLYDKTKNMRSVGPTSWEKMYAPRFAQLSNELQTEPANQLEWEKLNAIDFVRNRRPHVKHHQAWPLTTKGDGADKDVEEWTNSYNIKNDDNNSKDTHASKLLAPRTWDIDWHAESKLDDTIKGKLKGEQSAADEVALTAATAAAAAPVPATGGRRRRRKSRRRKSKKSKKSKKRRKSLRKKSRRKSKKGKKSRRRRK